MRFTVGSGEKQHQDNSEEQTMQAAVTIPTAVATSSAAERKFITKKRIISAVVAVLVAAIVVTGIVVAIWIFTEQNKMMMQYKQNLISNDGSSASQTVSTNVDENVVQYHIVKDDNEWWIVEDHNKNIKVAKVKDNLGVVKCLLSGLDESLSTKPDKVVAPSNQDQKAIDSASVADMMTIAENPVKDTSFLSKTATSLCANTPVYWTYKTCINDANVLPSDDQSPEGRSKRQTLMACTPCGCGYQVCLSCGSIYYYYYYAGTSWYCTWNVNYCLAYGYYVYTCPSATTAAATTVTTTKAPSTTTTTAATTTTTTKAPSTTTTTAATTTTTTKAPSTTTTTAKPSSTTRRS